MPTPTHLSCRLPFGGFYYSHHSGLIDYAEQCLYQDTNGDAFSGSLVDSFLGEIDYSALHEAYAGQYTVELADLLGIQLTFETLTSPREYNFQTDRIFALISRADFAKLLRVALTRPSPDSPRYLTTTARDLFTSRDGFISFYSPDWRVWGKPSTWDHNQTYAVLCAALAASDEPDYLDHPHDYIGSDIVEELICHSLSAKGKRILRAFDYLRRRQER